MIKTPPGWGYHILTQAYQSVTGDPAWHADQAGTTPMVRRIGVDDLRWALDKGWEDFKACRTDVIFLCIFYPIAGLLLARLAFGYELLPLVFPLISGYALLGPLAAIGLNEMSRRRERNEPHGWAAAFNVLRSPSIVAIMALGAVLMMMFIFWLTLAHMIYGLTLGPAPPESMAGFMHDVLHTRAGLAMAFIGIGIGFVFAVIALSITVVSFPMLLDRRVSLETAVKTSVQLVQRNPGTMAVWGMIITVSLVLGSIPALLGLIFVLPVLGHATWHLYRRAVPAAV